MPACISGEVDSNEGQSLEEQATRETAQTTYPVYKRQTLVSTARPMSFVLNSDGEESEWSLVGLYTPSKVLSGTDDTEYSSENDPSNHHEFSWAYGCDGGRDQVSNESSVGSDVRLRTDAQHPRSYLQQAANHMAHPKRRSRSRVRPKASDGNTTEKSQYRGIFHRASSPLRKRSGRDVTTNKTSFFGRALRSFRRFKRDTPSCTKMTRVPDCSSFTSSNEVTPPDSSSYFSEEDRVVGALNEEEIIFDEGPIYNRFTGLPEAPSRGIMFDISEEETRGRMFDLAGLAYDSSSVVEIWETDTNDGMSTDDEMFASYREEVAAGIQHSPSFSGNERVTSSPSPSQQNQYRVSESTEELDARDGELVRTEEGALKNQSTSEPAEFHNVEPNPDGEPSIAQNVPLMPTEAELNDEHLQQEASDRSSSVGDCPSDEESLELASGDSVLEPPPLKRRISRTEDSAPLFPLETTTGSNDRKKHTPHFRHGKAFTKRSKPTPELVESKRSKSPLPYRVPEPIVPEGLISRASADEVIDQLGLGMEGRNVLCSLRDKWAETTVSDSPSMYCPKRVPIPIINVKGLEIPDYDFYVKRSVSLFQRDVLKISDSSLESVMQQGNIRTT